MQCVIREPKRTERADACFSGREAYTTAMAALAEPIQQLRLLEQVPLAGLSLPLTLRLPVAFTVEELMEFSYRNRPYQIERNAQGELVIMSPTGWNGMRRVMYVARIMDVWAEEHGGKAAGPTAGFRLQDTSVRGPDAAWVASVRIDGLTEEERRKYPPLCPEFLIEILSESDSRGALEAKMKLWMDAGAQLAWMIDPYAAEVVIYRAGSQPEQLERPDWVEADAVVTGFRLETARMWEK